MEINVIGFDDSELTPEEREENIKRRNKKAGRVLASSAGSAAVAITAVIPQADFITTLNDLHNIGDKVINGRLKGAERMLICQARALQAVFSQFTDRMAQAETIVQMEAHSKIAFRAQNQCQRTLRTLLEYKNPKRATFIKQQNNAINQQINEGERPKEVSEKKVEPANELLEVNHEARLDIGTTQTPKRANPLLEAVGKVDRAKDA